jgi:hypothetical protein
MSQFSKGNFSEKLFVAASVAVRVGVPHSMYRTMKQASDIICDSYLIDTYKLMTTGKFLPAAITFKGRKKIDIMRWEEHSFDTKEEADNFVREHFRESGIPEAENEGEIFNKNPKN